MEGLPFETRARVLPQDWSLALLVRVDEITGRLAPSIQLSGYEADSWLRIRLELVDADGAVRLTAGYRFSQSAVGTEFPLDSFLPPGGANVDDVLRWRWDLVLEGRYGERVRLRKRLRQAGPLSIEAELEPRELTPAPAAVRPDIAGLRSFSTHKGSHVAGRMQLYVAGARPGSLPAVGGANGMAWWLTSYGRWRLEAEAEAVLERFPGFRLFQAGECLSWLGWLESALSERRYLVRVSYPSNYPDEAPDVEIERPELPDGVPHLLAGQQPCLFRQGGPRHGYDPGRTTAATLIAWTSLWIHAFEAWQATGVWPGKEA
jgi:hypothetical protein